MGRRKIIFDRVCDYFRKNNLTVIDISILQPADPFLDMVGEDLRRRIFVTESENGESLCLRPEFTIPVCLEHIASDRTTPQNYAYLGEVFRQKQGETSKFYQAGIEDLGAENTAEADARSLRHATSLLYHIVPEKDIFLRIGDHAVFSAVLAALDLPVGWQKKLLRCFGNNKQLHKLLDGFSTLEFPLCLPPEIYSLIKSDNRQALVSVIEQDMIKADFSPSAGRTPEEIAERLIEKQELENRCIEAPVLSALEDFLNIDVSLDRAEHALERFAGLHNLDLENIITLFSNRCRAIDCQGLDLKKIRFSAACRRALDYYTGLVYEFFDNRGDFHLLAGGGRYDRLLTMLGARVSVPAVGFSVWLNRL